MQYFLAFAALFATFALTRVVRQYALSRSHLDIPNDRSSHTVPTPRGGGVAIAVSVVFLALIAWLLGVAAPVGTFIPLLPAVIVAAVGYIDDRTGLSPLTRLAVHFFTATLLVLLTTTMVNSIGVPLAVVAVFACVWFTNLYNFMDGIDGIASIEAVTVAIGCIVCSLFVPSLSDVSILMWILLGASIGFLFWNAPPARIFMGDVGSGFIGMLLAGGVVVSSFQDLSNLTVWLVLLSVFIGDSGVTLATRLSRGKPPHIAHRSHAYQIASRRFKSHLVVSTAIGFYNILWLLPLAIAYSTGVISWYAALLLAYVPVCAVAVWYRAGHD